ncbi:Uma2 family endonuclease [Rhodopila sp.]|uniref:Uma2 family endonuclease n=1 Tax=Rhodopila sp. TaxID=2480087 RepID=UPI003D10001D
MTTHAETGQAAEIGLLTRNPWVARRPLTVAEYHRMGEVGILTERDRVELIEGELVAMAPIGSQHSGTVNGLNRMLMQAVGDRGVVSVQNPVQLGDRSEPEPDFTVLRPRADDYRRSTPSSEDVLLVIEIAASSLDYDRAVKRPLYASHGISELWIVNLAVGEVEVCRNPAGDDYASVSRVGREGVLEPLLLPGVAISVAALLG